MGGLVRPLGGLSGGVTLVPLGVLLLNSGLSGGDQPYAARQLELGGLCAHRGVERMNALAAEPGRLTSLTAYPYLLRSELR